MSVLWTSEEIADACLLDEDSFHDAHLEGGSAARRAGDSANLAYALDRLQRSNPKSHELVSRILNSIATRAGAAS